MDTLQNNPSAVVRDLITRALEEKGSLLKAKSDEQNSLRMQMDQKKLNGVERGEFSSLAKNWDKAFAKLTTTERRQFIRTFVGRIEILPDRLRIRYNYDQRMVARALNVLDSAAYRNSLGVGSFGPTPGPFSPKRDQRAWDSNTFRIGRAIEKTFEWPQLIDNFNLNFLEVGESAEKLAVLRVKKQLSMRQLSKETGHSLSYLRQQLREFGIAQEKSDEGLQPYGWRMVDRKLIPVGNEQRIICEMIERTKAGENSGDICRSLNKRGVPSKTGGKWWPSSIRRILSRERKRSTRFAKVNPS